MHAVRVVFVPPDVKEPLGQKEQFAALFELKRLSSPHCSQLPSAERNVPARQNSHWVAPALDVVPAAHVVQFDAPGAAEYVPATHSSMMLVPLHAEPAGHKAQFVRVALVPPDVNDPSGHGEHSEALFEL